MPARTKIVVAVLLSPRTGNRRRLAHTHARPPPKNRQETVKPGQTRPNGPRHTTPTAPLAAHGPPPAPRKIDSPTTPLDPPASTTLALAPHRGSGLISTHSTPAPSGPTPTLFAPTLALQVSRRLTGHAPQCATACPHLASRLVRQLIDRVGGNSSYLLIRGEIWDSVPPSPRSTVLGQSTMGPGLANGVIGLTVNAPTQTVFRSSPFRVEFEE